MKIAKVLKPCWVQTLKKNITIYFHYVHKEYKYYMSMGKTRMAYKPNTAQLFV